MIFMPGRREKDILFDTGYRAAIDDIQDNLIRNSRTETIDGRTRLIVTEDTIETICREMRKRKPETVWKQWTFFMKKKILH